MKKLRTLFYGMTHEHAQGKFETLKRLKDKFEIVAIVDDRPRGTPTHATDPFLCEGYRLVPESEAFGIEDIDVSKMAFSKEQLEAVAKGAMEV